jgi:hypothetical protein
MGANIFRIRDYIRDALFTSRTSNFWVLYLNRMLGISPHLGDEAVKDIGGMGGTDLVHLSEEAYRAIARAIEDDALCLDTRYTTHPPPPPRGWLGPNPRGPGWTWQSPGRSGLRGALQPSRGVTYPRVGGGGAPPPSQGAGDVAAAALVKNQTTAPSIGRSMEGAGEALEEANKTNVH